MLKLFQYVFLYYLIVMKGNQHATGIPVMNYDYVQDANVWLRLHTLPADWQDARLRCQLEGGVLASPTSSSLTKAMLTMMATHQLTSKRVFTGINALVARGYFMTVDGKMGIPLSNFSHRWTDGEPNNAKNPEDCLTMNGVGELADISCARVYPFFCRKDNAKMSLNKCGSTDDAYQLEPRTGSCYKFHQLARTWHQAAADCFAEGGYLAIINSALESQVLKELFAKHPDSTLRAKYTHVAMIGFWDWNEHIRNREWLTIFGEVITIAGFRQWSNKAPNNYMGAEDCGAINKIDGLFKDVSCLVPYPFICEMEHQQFNSKRVKY